MRTVIQRIDARAKAFDEFKKQGTTLPSATTGNDGQSAGRRIPSELSVSCSGIVANAVKVTFCTISYLLYKPLGLQ